MPTVSQPLPHTQRSVTPLERDVLLATYQAPSRTLRRHGSGFVAAPAFRTSGSTRTQGFTKRIAIRLRDDGLLAFDDDHCPSTLSLTDIGVALVEQLLAAANEDRA